MAIATTLISRQGDTIDALAWRELGLGADDIGPLLDTNRGVADLGPVLPLGTKIVVPANAPAPAVLEIVQLWS